MTSFIALLPSIHQPWTDACVRSMTRSLREHLTIVDNTTDNRGVAASWNLGVDRLYREQVDWLIIISAAIRFSMDHGGRDFLQALDYAAKNAYALEAGHGMGWHLIAFHRRVFDLVGRFDENFHPAYWEDLDFARRVYLANNRSAPLWQKVSVEVSLRGFCHGVDLGGAKTDPDRMLAYWSEKWGGPPGEETFASPFNLRRGLDYWPPYQRETTDGA